MNAQTDAAAFADTLFFNGKIATQDDKRSFVTAIAVKDGRILATGNDHELAQRANGNTRRIDLRGRTVIPGLNDAHPLRRRCPFHLTAQHGKRVGQ